MICNKERIAFPLNLFLGLSPLQAPSALRHNDSQTPAKRERPFQTMTVLKVSASQPLYGGTTVINREARWHNFSLRGLFAVFLKRFQQLTSSVSASRPLAWRKIAGFGCQKIRGREVGWQKV